jgi:hypothetical protein
VGSNPARVKRWKKVSNFFGNVFSFFSYLYLHTLILQFFEQRYAICICIFFLIYFRDDNMYIFFNLLLNNKMYIFSNLLLNNNMYIFSTYFWTTKCIFFQFTSEQQYVYFLQLTSEQQNVYFSNLLQRRTGPGSFGDTLSTSSSSLITARAGAGRCRRGFEAEKVDKK